MSQQTGIEWTDATFNIAWGCTKVSAGCARCYAERESHRYGHDVWGPGSARRTFGEKHWNEPRRWNKAAAARGERFLVFTSSMADVFEEHETINAERARLWELIRDTPALTWQVCTKRPERIQSNLPPFWDEIRGRVWLLTSAEDQPNADRRIPILLSVTPRPAVYGVSAEPLLGPVDLWRWLDACPLCPDRSGFESMWVGRDNAREWFPCAGVHPIDWIIVGGESGPGARPCDVAWVRSIVEQCRAAQVACFVKQLGARPCHSLSTYGRMPCADGGDERPAETRIDLKSRKGGEPSEWPEDLRVREFPEAR